MFVMQTFLNFMKASVFTFLNEKKKNPVQYDTMNLNNTTILVKHLIPIQDYALFTNMLGITH